MTIRERFIASLPVLRIPQTCEGCGQPFECRIGVNGCWCLHVELSKDARRALREQYRRCICRPCLESAEAKSRTGA